LRILGASDQGALEVKEIIVSQRKRFGSDARLDGRRTFLTRSLSAATAFWGFALTSTDSKGGMSSASRILDMRIAQSNIALNRSFAETVQLFERELQLWPRETSVDLISRQAPWSAVQAEVARLGGRRGLMIFSKIDSGRLTSLSGRRKNGALYLVGNPVIANEILNIDPKGAFYVPFRVALYAEGGEGRASLCYDRPSSFLARLDPRLAAIGLELDSKIDAVASALRPASASG
jgi:uncharacterized protein (DUF302 family)